MEVDKYHHHSMLPEADVGKDLEGESDGELASLFGDDEDGSCASLFMEAPSPIAVDATSQSPAGWSWTMPSPSALSAFQEPSHQETALSSPSPICEEVSFQQHDQVSTQNPEDEEQAPSAAELEMELQLELELELHKELNIDSPQAETVPSHDAQACHVLHVEQEVATGRAVSERPKCQPSTRSSPLLPPRIDLVCPDIEAILPCINLATKGLTNAAIFEQLGLDAKRGRSLMEHAREYLAQPEHAIHLVGQQDQDYRRKTKTALIEAALTLLVVDSWGEKWFSPDPFHSQDIDLLWPQNSTEIFYRFIPLLYKLARNASQRKYAAKVREKKKNAVATETSPTPSAPGSWYASSPKTESPATTPLSTIPSGFQLTGTMQYVSIRVSPTAIRPEKHKLNHPQTRGPTPQPEGFGILHQEPPSKKFKVDAGLEKPELQGPDLPNLTYIVNVMEGLSRVIPPITLRLTGNPPASVFYTLLTRLAELGLFGIIEVYTAEGLALISDEQSWNTAIRTVDEDESMDRTVRVRIQVTQPVIFSG